MAAQNMPAAEVEITADLVRALLAEQFAHLADRPLTRCANGWDNTIFRLGDDLLVRMPRRAISAGLVEHEQRWLPELASRLPIPICAPVYSGRPGCGYPWSWSVCPWFDGDVAADVALADPIREAERLGAFVAALHQPAPADAPYNEFRRGQPIAEFIPRIEANLAALEGAPTPESAGDPGRPGSPSARPGLAAVRPRLAELAGVAEWDGPALWLHGDLHSANIIVADGSVAAVIDFGDLTSGDPAVDFAVAWMLFDGPDRAVFRAAAGGRAGPIDDATWQRGQLWALHFAVLYLLHSADSERFQRMGTSLLAAVLA
ncbi:MAG: aminoglycoside phosphotransferase family protein [Ilumatobacteraceae bacterium]